MTRRWPSSSVFQQCRSFNPLTVKSSVLPPIARCERRATQCARSLHGSARSHIESAFTYKIAAAFSGKSNVFDKSRHHFAFDSTTGKGGYADASLLSRGRKLPSGQDSFFVASVGDSSAVAFAVADGVGGYNDHGVDSADFAHGLTRCMREAAEGASGDQSSNARVTPLQLLQQGYSRLCSDKKIKGGGSTACVAIANPDGMLNVANLGDSGFVHLRANKVQHYSKPQTHAFNTPFQLSTVPPKILAQIENFGGSLPFNDMPKDASISSHELKHGDVLCFGTDGVWDNLTSEDVLDRVSRVMTANGAWAALENQEVQTNELLLRLTRGTDNNATSGRMPLQSELAIDITEKAKAASVDTRRDGPFAKAVQESYPRERWHGGKIDDICIVVAVVLRDDAV